MSKLETIIANRKVQIISLILSLIVGIFSLLGGLLHLLFIGCHDSGGFCSGERNSETLIGFIAYTTIAIPFLILPFTRRAKLITIITLVVLVMVSVVGSLLYFNESN